MAPSVPLGTLPAVRGVTDKEIRFGIVAPFSGASRELGRQMKLGIDTAFNRVNDTGGVNGRMLRLLAADDGYEPSRTLDAMKTLYDKDQVFGFVGNVGTPTAAVAIPFALERRALFFGAFTGSNILRNDPPDRYVFNYRASYAEETDAVVHYLVKIRKLQPRQIAVFAQADAYGDAGFAGVAKAFRTLGVNDASILRLNYKRNTVDVDDAVSTLKAQKGQIRAVVMVATYRAAAKFIERTRDSYPGMIYSNVSFVGSTALADELMLLGPRYANGVIVTQVVPAVGGYSSAVMEYKNALAKYFPGEAPDYVSLEGYIAANVLIQAIRQTGPELNTEKLIDNLEAMRNLDLGLGTALEFRPLRAPGLAQDLGHGDRRERQVRAAGAGLERIQTDADIAMSASRTIAEADMKVDTTSCPKFFCRRRAISKKPILLASFTKRAQPVIARQIGYSASGKSQTQSL